jgi:hypothetical protein
MECVTINKEQQKLCYQGYRICLSVKKTLPMGWEFLGQWVLFISKWTHFEEIVMLPALYIKPIIFLFLFYLPPNSVEIEHEPVYLAFLSLHLFLVLTGSPTTIYIILTWRPSFALLKVALNAIAITKFNVCLLLNLCYYFTCPKTGSGGDERWLLALLTRDIF